MSANIGDPITKKLTSGRLYCQLTGPNQTADVFWRDLGNVEDYKFDPKLDRKEHMKSYGGLKQTDLSLVATLAGKYSFTLDEFTTDLEALYMLATQGSDAVQSGGAITSETITTNAQQGRSYFLANLGASSVVLKVGSTVAVQGVDYQLDTPATPGATGSGVINLLNGSAVITNGSTLTATTYTAAAVTQHVFTAFQQLIQFANFKLVEYDQFSTVPREITTFNGQLYVTNWGDNKEDYTKPVLDVLVFGAPTVKRRAD